jgi:hypothetical protein
MVYYSNAHDHHCELHVTIIILLQIFCEFFSPKGALLLYTLYILLSSPNALLRSEDKLL